MTKFKLAAPVFLAVIFSIFQSACTKVEPNTDPNWQPEKIGVISLQRTSEQHRDKILKFRALPKTTGPQQVLFRIHEIQKGKITKTEKITCTRIFDFKLSIETVGINYTQKRWWWRSEFIRYPHDTSASNTKPIISSIQKDNFPIPQEETTISCIQFLPKGSTTKASSIPTVKQACKLSKTNSGKPIYLITAQGIAPFKGSYDAAEKQSYFQQLPPRFWRDAHAFEITRGHYNIDNIEIEMWYIAKGKITKMASIDRAKPCHICRFLITRNYSFLQLTDRINPSCRAQPSREDWYLPVGSFWGKWRKKVPVTKQPRVIYQEFYEHSSAYAHNRHLTVKTFEAANTLEKLKALSIKYIDSSFVVVTGRIHQKPKK